MGSEAGGVGISFKRESINYILSLIFICGWLLPKLNIGANVGVQELAAVLILLYRYKISSQILSIMYADICFAVLLLAYGVLYLLILADVEGFLIGVRTILFVFASMSFSNYSLLILKKLLNVVIFITFLFVLWSVSRILLNIIFNSFDLNNFLYGSDSYRVRAPFQNGGASSQVPIGYLLALILCLPTVMDSRFKKIVFMLGAIGTTSRASILSIALVYLRKIKLTKFSGFFTIVFISLIGLVMYLKSTSLNDGELDGSASKRLELYSSSYSIMIEHPAAIFLGFGVSTSALADSTGEGFYESFIINSLMQGGILLFIGSILILLKTLYYDYKLKLHSIGVVVFFGNALGGSNYFSMFAYPLMVLIICYTIKDSTTKLNNENSSFNNNN